MFSWPSPPHHSSSSTQQPNDTAATTEESSQHHHHHHHVPLQHLLGALAFEHSPIPFRRHVKSSPETTTTTTPASKWLPSFPLPFGTKSAPSSPLVMPPEVARRSLLRHNSMKEASTTTTPVRAAANRILFGTLDPDGHVEDVFFDAQEFGDGLDDNEFDATTSYHRDSILVSSIFTTKRGGGVSSSSSSSIEKQKGPLEDVNDDLNEEESTYSESFYGDTQLDNQQQNFAKYLSTLPPPPSPPQELPLRFLRAGKGDPVEGLRRYEATLAWRKQHGMDTILRQPCWEYKIIKQYYPSYCHLRGRNNECVYYEQPPRTNLKALRDAGVTLEQLLRFYAMVTEFQWQMLERDDLARSITVIDVQGIKMGDFVGEVKNFVLAASDFCGQHYPERAGYVFVINVPAWFKLIFNVIKPFIDETTLEKIKILRGADEIQRVMEERIPLENLPPEYGGTSMPLGQSPEEELFAALCEHNNALARGEMDYCNGLHGNPPCRFCSWVPARSY